MSRWLHYDKIVFYLLWNPIPRIPSYCDVVSNWVASANIWLVTVNPPQSIMSCERKPVVLVPSPYVMENELPLRLYVLDFELV
jgi:hypothetical protein